MIWTSGWVWTGDFVPDTFVVIEREGSHLDDSENKNKIIEEVKGHCYKIGTQLLWWYWFVIDGEGSENRSLGEVKGQWYEIGYQSLWYNFLWLIFDGKCILYRMSTAHCLANNFWWIQQFHTPYVWYTFLQNTSKCELYFTMTIYLNPWTLFSTLLQHIMTSYLFQISYNTLYPFKFTHFCSFCKMLAKSRLKCQDSYIFHLQTTGCLATELWTII